jgi:hypothetical protein
VSSNPAHAVGLGCSRGTLVLSINKSGRHEITEILLKVTINTITVLLDVL